MFFKLQFVIDQSMFVYVCDACIILLVFFWGCKQNCLSGMNKDTECVGECLYSCIKRHQMVCTCVRPQPVPCCTAGQEACNWGACHWCRRRDSMLLHECSLQHHSLEDKHILILRHKISFEFIYSENAPCHWPDSSHCCRCWLPVSDVWLRMSDMRAELRAFPANRLMPDMGSAWSWTVSTCQKIIVTLIHAVSWYGFFY